MKEKKSLRSKERYPAGAEPRRIDSGTAGPVDVGLRREGTRGI